MYKNYMSIHFIILIISLLAIEQSYQSQPDVSGYYEAHNSLWGVDIALKPDSTFEMYYRTDYIRACMGRLNILTSGKWVIKESKVYVSIEKKYTKTIDKNNHCIDKPTNVSEQEIYIFKEPNLLQYFDEKNKMSVFCRTGKYYKNGQLRYSIVYDYQYPIDDLTIKGDTVFYFENGEVERFTEH